MVGDAVCLPASYDATGVYFRQPQSEEPVLQSLMMRGGDRAYSDKFLDVCAL